jgi:hypothetical protein
VYAKEAKKYYRIKGKAKLYTKGKYFDMANKINSGPKTKCAVLIQVNDVFDLDKVKKIDL